MGHYGSEMRNWEHEEKEYKEDYKLQEKSVLDTVKKWLKDHSTRKGRGSVLRLEARVDQHHTLHIDLVEESNVHSVRVSRSPA